MCSQINSGGFLIDISVIKPGENTSLLISEKGFET